MKKVLRFLVIFFVLLIVILYISGKYSEQTSHTFEQGMHQLTQSLTVTPSITVAVNPSAFCHIHGVLPDPNCTPGAIDPSVTQNDIMQTICTSGYTQTVRPPVSYTNSLKIQQITLYGYTDTNTKDYEEDHLISLELGGSPTDPKNLWPEPGASPNPKDKIENLCHKKVCDEELSLAIAQKEIATDWQTACQ